LLRRSDIGHFNALEVLGIVKKPKEIGLRNARYVDCIVCRSERTQPRKVLFELCNNHLEELRKLIERDREGRDKVGR
jgi:hypothetical protein